MEEAESETGLKISCLITDAFCWFASDMAENRGVPWVPFWTAASCSLSAHLYTDKIQNTLGSADPEEDQTVTFIPGLSNVHITDLPPEIFIDKNPTPLALTIYNMVTKLPKSTAIVLNSFEEIDPIITKDLKSKFNNYLNVGPSILSSPIPPTTNPNDPHNCLKWLQTQNNPNSVIYISFGTVISPPPNEIAELAQALESCKFPFLWSIKDHAQKALPQGFENRTKNWGKIVPWAPQLEILRQNCVGVFVTHCGWNSVVESICGGVPMICRPFFGDQRINGRMVEDVWKIGVRVRDGVFW
ncbi:glycosyltransferase [Acinetobacter baumannii]